MQMKYFVWAVFFTPLGALCALCLAAEESGKLPPLVVDRDNLLKLKDEKPVPIDPWGGPAAPVADNLACHCCHANYKEESLAVTHAKANIGCVKCHGKSPKHQEDEDNVTPPEIMYPASKINKACAKCHDSHDVPAEKVVALWQQRCPDKTDPKQIVCTDCHGRHRLKVRTVRWEKDTGKLIVCDVEKKAKEDSCPDMK